MQQTDQQVKHQDQLELYASMLRMRLVETRIIDLYSEQEIRCPTHFSIGQEAVAAGVTAHLAKSDYAISAHRSHAHYLGKGGDLRRMLAELYGKAPGCASGKGGSMHLIDKSVSFLGCVPIVGSTIPIGVGAAFSASMRNENRLAAVFFGEGAVETGVFHESVNFAVLRNLPVLFVCENNLYSVNTPLSERQPANRRISELAEAHGLLATRGDGQDLGQVFELTGEIISQMRRERAPGFIELMTYRWTEHCGPLSDEHLGFRPTGEFDSWRDRDPIELYETKLGRKLLNDTVKDRIVSSITAEINDAVSFAKRSPFPARTELTKGVYA